MKDFVRAPALQCQLLTPAGPPTMARKSPRTDDVALAWIKNAEVHSALVHVTDVSESRIGLWCPDFVPTGFMPPHLKSMAIKGHPFGMELSEKEKKALIAFMKTL